MLSSIFYHFSLAAILVAENTRCLWGRGCLFGGDSPRSQHIYWCLFKSLRSCRLLGLIFCRGMKPSQGNTGCAQCPQDPASWSVHIGCCRFPAIQLHWEVIVHQEEFLFLSHWFLKAVLSSWAEGVNQCLGNSEGPHSASSSLAGVNSPLCQHKIF